MSETPNTSNSAENGAQAGPIMRVVAQYLKDMSFENPNAPAIYSEMAAAPQIEVNVDVSARTVGQDHYEVELSVAARAEHEDKPVFVVESTYAGVFLLQNIPEEHLEAVMVVECPRMLFPFLRQIISDATRNGNFPPLMLEPIDFMRIYEQRQMAEAQNAGESGVAN
ncbi:MAG: protein-export chaperone SecB [Pseudomonadota bacterium]